jgi:hypothetical protein
MTGHQSFSLRLGITDSAISEGEVLNWFLIAVGCSLGGGTIPLTTHFGVYGT